MRKKQLNIKMNPFDKTKTAAENMFAPPEDNVEHVGYVGLVEQQYNGTMN